VTILVTGVNIPQGTVKIAKKCNLDYVKIITRQSALSRETIHRAPSYGAMLVQDANSADTGSRIAEELVKIKKTRVF
jgi:hypothetical protein